MVSADTQQNDATTQGVVVAVRDSVVDAEFPHQLPKVNSELRTGRDHEVVIEVLSQVSSRLYVFAHNNLRIILT
jgi:F0F1-type ATP synthase beta subunit